MKSWDRVWQRTVSSTGDFISRRTISCRKSWTQKTLKPLRDGMEGELVISTLTKEGLPLIRYRTKDLTSINHEICECGRTTARIARFTGRTDDMLIIRGVNVFPSQIESALLEMAGPRPTTF